LGGIKEFINPLQHPRGLINSPQQRNIVHGVLILLLPIFLSFFRSFVRSFVRYISFIVLSTCGILSWLWIVLWCSRGACNSSCFLLLVLFFYAFLLFFLVRLWTFAKSKKKKKETTKTNKEEEEK
jgi:threonine/homoserine/homoserine lactone efflux protein